MDILLCQETRSDGSYRETKKWSKMFYTNHIFLTEYGSESVGVGIIIRNNDKFRVDNVIKDPLGRFVAVTGDHEEGRFLISSFYCPSQNNDIKKFVEDDLIGMISSLEQDNCLPQYLVIAGDTNTPLTLKDKEGGSKVLKQGAINSFLGMQEKYNLQDIFRVKQPDSSKFSWERLNPSIIRERIDVIFTSIDLQDNIPEADIIPRFKTCSDHGMPIIHIKGFGIQTRGPGIWKFNNALLEDTEFLFELKSKLQHWIDETKVNPSQSLGSQWGFIKHKVGEFSRQFGAKRRKERMALKNKIESELSSLSSMLSDYNKMQYDSLKQQLKELIEYEVRGSIIRSLSQNYEEGEKCSKYFFSLEKQKAKQKTICKLKLDNGEEITNQDKILNECRLFYKKLYKSNDSVDPESPNYFYENCNIPKLSSSEALDCEKSLTLTELHKTLKLFRKNKSPGLDGLTAEFYLKFWDQLGPTLLGVYEESFISGILPENMRVGVITLLEKKNKDRLRLENWRPITLLGVDYKLLSKCMAERLKNVLPNLIHSDQNGFVPGGNIFFSTHTIRDILFYCEKEKLDLFMLAIDYTKAFDFLEFSCINKTLKIFNFQDNFCRWINIFLTGGKSCISNNGFLSERFDIERSTRQGDCISPMIFILCLEILFVTVRSDRNIKGIKIEGEEIKLSALADDASYFLRDENSVFNLLSTIESFSRISGLQVNRSKSECLILQFESHLANYEENIFGIPVVDNLKILGHYFGKNQLICNYQNFYSKIKKVERILNMWKQRDLTIFGKNVLLTSLINSQLLYNAQIEIPPNDFIKQIESIKKRFLWGGGVSKIAHNSLIGTTAEGGINYKDIQTQINSMNVKYITGLKECKSKRKIIPLIWIKQLFMKISNIKENESEYYNYFVRNTLDIIGCCSFKLPRKNKWEGHPYYYDILSTIQRLTVAMPNDIHEMLSTPIWYNKFLGTTFDCSLSRQGFNFLKDIIIDGEPVKSDHLKSIKIEKRKQAAVLRICESMPFEMKTLISQNSSLQTVPYPRTCFKIGNSIFYIKNTNTKDYSKNIYSNFISRKAKLPIGMQKWCLKFDLSMDRIKNAFTFANTCTLSTKSIALQYKISTFTLPTGEYLWNYCVRDNYFCSRCAESLIDPPERDDIMHSLFLCPQIRPFLSKIFKFLTDDCKAVPNISHIDYFLGSKENIGLNCLLLELKKFIFYNFDHNSNVDIQINMFKSRLKRIIILEKRYYLRRDKIDYFHEKWEKFSEVYMFYGPDPMF